MTFIYEYERPSVTTDIAIVTDDCELLVIERINFPHGFALPGGFLEKNEDLRQCAARELKEETGIIIPSEKLCFVNVYSDPKRDPRNWVITALFSYFFKEKPVVVPADDAKSYKWIKSSEIKNTELVFDHQNLAFDAIHHYIDYLDHSVAGCF